jgi:ribosomal protein S18 acetylase RimI-like enzyme
LAKLLGPAGVARLFLDTLPDPPVGWTVSHRDSMTQMVRTPMAVLTEPAGTIETLNTSALPAMMELAQLTKPGPFGPRTPELGLYLGIYQSGRLAAMAGERLRCAGYAEVSAVCTHPDFQGRGYASALVSAIVAGMVARGETPILHVRSTNEAAIHVYERLGFVSRRLLHFGVLTVGTAAATQTAASI